MVIAAGSVIKEPSSGPMMRMVIHQAAGVPPPGARDGPQRRFGEADNRPRRRQRHDHHDEQGFRVVDGLVDVMLRWFPSHKCGGHHEQHDGPETENHFDLAQEVQELRDNARPGAALLRPRVPVVPLLYAMRQGGETAGGKCVDDGERENAGRNRVERLQLHPGEQFRAEPLVRQRWIACQGPRDLGHA